MRCIYCCISANSIVLQYLIHLYILLQNINLISQQSAIAVHGIFCCNHNWAPEMKRGKFQSTHGYIWGAAEKQSISARFQNSQEAQNKLNNNVTTWRPWSSLLRTQWINRWQHVMLKNTKIIMYHKSLLPCIYYLLCIYCCHAINMVNSFLL